MLGGRASRAKKCARASGRRAQENRLENIKRIFFDSGMVLVYPKSGQWFFPNCYFEYCKENDLEIADQKLNENYQIAYKNLSSKNLIINEEQEEQAFREFYKSLFSGIEGKDNIELIEKCTAGKVKDYAKYVFYEDVRSEIPKLGNRYRIGIISDAWPSLLNVYRKNDMLNYFDPFVISSMKGFTKETEKLFLIAMSEINEKPEECLFIDDSYGNCVRAQEIGMKSIMLNRNKYQTDKGNIKAISTLVELSTLLLG